MPDPHRTIRIPDHVWRPAQHTAEERGEVVSEVIRELLATYIAEHAAGRLVRLEIGHEVVGVDPLTLRAMTGNSRLATAYRWSEAKQVYGKRPQTVTLTDDQAAEVQR